MRYEMGKLARVVAVVVLTGQSLPVGLPLLCGQVQQRTPANCEQPMPGENGPGLQAESHALPCANTAFCATTATATLALVGSVLVSQAVSYDVTFEVPPLSPAEPQAPLPPPPLA